MSAILALCQVGQAQNQNVFAQEYTTPSIALLVPVSGPNKLKLQEYEFTCDKPSCSLGSFLTIAVATYETSAARSAFNLFIKVEKSTQNNSVFDTVLLGDTIFGVSAPTPTDTTSATGHIVFTTPFVYTGSKLRVTVYAFGINSSAVGPRVNSLTSKWGYVSSTSDVQREPVAPGITITPVGNSFSLTVDAKNRYNSAGAQVPMNTTDVKSYVGRNFRSTLAADANNKLYKTWTYVNDNSSLFGYNLRPVFNYASLTTSPGYPTDGEFRTEYTVTDLAGKVSAVTFGPVVKNNTFLAPKILSTQCSSTGPTSFLPYVSLTYSHPQKTNLNQNILPTKFVGVTYYVYEVGNTTTPVLTNYRVEALTTTNLIIPINLPPQGYYQIKLCAADVNLVEGDCSMSQPILLYAAVINFQLKYRCSVQ